VELSANGTRTYSAWVPVDLIAEDPPATDRYGGLPAVLARDRLVGTGPADRGRLPAQTVVDEA